MKRIAVVAALATIALGYAWLWLADRLLGGDGPRVTLSPEHRRLLDRRLPTW